MRVFYKKGSIIPTWIGKSANPKNQKAMTFNVDCAVACKTVRALKKCHHVITVGNERKKRFQPTLKLNARFIGIHVITKSSTEYGISYRKY